MWRSVGNIWRTFRSIKEAQTPYVCPDGTLVSKDFFRKKMWRRTARYKRWRSYHNKLSKNVKWNTKQIKKIKKQIEWKFRDTAIAVADVTETGTLTLLTDID